MQVTEMDTVEGQKGGKVLLTLLFRSCSLMLAFLMEEKSQECVKDIFDYLTKALGINTFHKLFPVILTDNGTEFQDTEGLECDCNGEIRTKIYYCHPNCSWQKGMIEKNHEYIRYIVAKGMPFDGYSQGDISLMMSHINNTARDSLNGCTPYQLSRLLFGSSLLEKLSIMEIAPDDVMLKPALLKH
jgi:IS30 family transposase